MSGMYGQNVKEFPINRKGRARTRLNMRALSAMAAIMLVFLGVLLLQKKQSDRQNLDLRDLSIRMTVVERRTREMWLQLGLPDDPVTYAIRQL